MLKLRRPKQSHAPQNFGSLATFRDQINLTRRCFFLLWALSPCPLVLYLVRRNALQWASTTNRNRPRILRGPTKLLAVDHSSKWRVFIGPNLISYVYVFGGVRRASDVPEYSVNKPSSKNTQTIIKINVSKCGDRNKLVVACKLSFESRKYQAICVKLENFIFFKV